VAYRGADPTAVMGRRIGAYLLDGLILGVLAVAIMAPSAFGALKTAPTGTYDCTTAVQATTERPRLLAVCLDSGGEIKYMTTGDAARIQRSFVLVTALEWVVFYVLLQGLAGASLGKLALGLRVVKPNGEYAGIGRCALRTLILPIDAACCAIIGLLTSFKSRGHRRLGDMAADTLVIGKDDQQALQLARSGAALPDRRTLAAAQYAETIRPNTPTWEERANQIHIPGAPAIPGTEQALANQQQRPDQAPSAAETTWDERRGAYVWFDPESQSWLQHDAVTGQWKPLDT